MPSGRPRRGPTRNDAPHGGDTESPIRPGDRVAHYQVLAEIGRGGMGVIFRARDYRLHRDVALKCPWPRLAADPTVRERFLREARSASQVSHPHVVAIFEILKWRGLPWIAMELVEGSSLRAVLQQQGPLPLRRALACAEALADALRVAHEKGIIHRDITPNNVLIRPDGWVLLTDFGLAHVFSLQSADASATTEDGPLTEPGLVLGTRGYMSPEQVLGKPLDPRSDIFSLGAVLYEMCTGRRAFEPDKQGNANDAILHRDPAAMRAIDATIPHELERIIRKALAKHPDERHAEARDFKAEIAALRRSVESVDHAPLVAPLRARTSGLRLPVAALALVAVFVLLYALAPRMRSTGSPLRSFAGGTPRQLTSDTGCEAEPALSPDGGLIAYTAIAADGSDIWIIDAKGGSRLRLTDDGAMNRSPAWFPDGTALVFVSDRGGQPSVWKVPRLGGPPVLLAPQGIDPAIAPDGKRMAAARANAAGRYRIAVVPLDEPERVTWITGDDDGERDHGQPAWSPDGRTICYADARNLWLVNLDGQPARRLTTENGIDDRPAWSSDGRFIVFTSEREGTRALWRIAAAGGPAERLTVGSGPEAQESISSDGSKMAYSTYSDDYDVVLVDLARGRRELIRSLLYDASPSFAPDGRALAFASSRRGGRYDIWTQALSDASAAGPPKELTELSGIVNMPAWSPDGKWIAFKREVQDLREIWIAPAGGGIPARFSEGSGSDNHPAWSPDGAQLAYATGHGAALHIEVAPIENGRRVGRGRQLTFGVAPDRLPAWSPDGRTIAFVANSGDQNEIRLVPSAGGAVSGPIAKASRIGRLRWERASGWLWFTTAVGRGETQLLKVPPQGGTAVAAVAPEWFAEAAPPGDFDLSPDGRVLAFTRQQIRGDVWLLESRQGLY